MKRTRKSAFTLVELVIVIAVIAILAAVMIPVFGGIIDSANKASDQSTAANLTVAISAELKGVNSAKELYDVIIATYGEDYANNMTPKSAKQGNHFWYDAKTKRVELATYAQLDEIIEKTKDYKSSSIDSGVTLVNTTNSALDYTPFESGNLRSVKNGRFFLIDKKGSDIVELLDSIEKITDVNSYTTIADKLSLSTDALSIEIFNNFSKIAYLNDYGLFAFTSNNISSIKVLPNTTTTSHLTYVDGEMVDRSDVDLSGVQSIVLPKDVEVGALSLNGFANGSDYDSTPTIHVDTTADKLDEIFEANSTDCVIVLPDNSKYVVEGTEIYKLPKTGNDTPVVGNLNSDSLENSNFEFDITCPTVSTIPGESETYYNQTEDTIYVAYNYTGEIKLNLTNGVSASMMTWVATNYDSKITSDPAISVNNGVLSINRQIEIGDNNMFTVTATLNGSEKSESINVCIIRPNDVSFKIDKTEYSGTSVNGLNINLNYINNLEFSINDVAVACSKIVKIDGVDVSDVTFGTSGNNLFQLHENKGVYTIILNTQATYTGSQTLTVKLGSHITLNFNVTVTDNSKSPFELNKIQDQDIGKLFLFRVGNENGFALGKIFDAIKTNENLTGAITIDVYNFKAAGGLEVLIKSTDISKTTVNGTGLNASITSGATWDLTTIDFDGTGIAKIVLTDNRGRSSHVLLEVVDGKNVTTATNATESNIILLNEITLTGTLSISNGYTLYGNGYTINLPTTATQTDAGWYGFIEIGSILGASGHLENAKVVGHVYPVANYYSSNGKIPDTTTYQYLKNSIKVYGGNSSITNCYISGSRTPLVISGGNVTVSDTTLSGGALANLEITGGNSVTLHNLTTYQSVQAATKYDSTKSTIGLGIIVSSDLVNLKVTGELDQRNWISKDEMSAYGPANYKDSLLSYYSNNSYSHLVNNNNINFGVVYLCDMNANKLSSVLNYEACENKANYQTSSVSITIEADPFPVTVSTMVWVPKNSVAINSTDPGFVSTEYTATAPTFTFDNSENAVEQNGKNPYCEYDNNITINIGVTASAPNKVLNLSGIKIEKNGSEITAYTIKFNGVEVAGDTVTVNMSNGVKQTLEIIATSDNGYDKSGNKRTGTKIYSWFININVENMEYGDPEWNMGNTYKFTDYSDKDFLYAYYTTSQGYAEAVAIFEGIKVNYYNSKGDLVTLDLSGTKTLPTDSGEGVFTYTLADGSTLTMTYVSGWKAGSNHFFTTYNNKVYVYPKALDTDAAVRAKTTNQDFDVKIKYTFTDPNGKSISQEMRWYNSKSNNGKVTTVQWKTFDSTNGKKVDVCVAPDTLVTLADGTQKMIKDVESGELVVAWNFFTGAFEVVPVPLVHGYESDYQNVLKLHFDDGTELDIVGEHGIFDADLKSFVFVDVNDIEGYVGHSFVKKAGDGFVTTKLTGYEVIEEYTAPYTMISEQHYNVVLNGMLTVIPSLDGGNFFNPFEINTDMKYDEAQVQADIEKYGLYTYDEFSEYITYEGFEAMQLSYFKVAVGKGLISYEALISMIADFNRYS